MIKANAYGHGLRSVAMCLYNKVYSFGVASIDEAEIPEEARKIGIIELDELFTYCQKKLTASTYGLLLIESEVKLLTLK